MHEYSERTLEGRSVILAGGSGGIGAAVADRVARKGGTPVIGFLDNEERARALARRIESRHGGVAPVVRGDVLDPSVRRCLLDTASGAGALYGLVPLVGQPARVRLEDASPEDFLVSTRINFVAPVLLARDFVAARSQEDGSIVFISTMQAVGVFPGSTLYAGPKAALIHTARILAKQWGGGDGPRVNVVAPGVTTSGMAAASVENGKYDPFIERGDIARFGEADDVARAVALLLEPDNYITGQVLAVDGGLTGRM